MFLLELFEGMYLNIIVIVMYFVARDMLFRLIYDFILHVVVVKSIVLIDVSALYKSPLVTVVVQWTPVCTNA